MLVFGFALTVIILSGDIAGRLVRRRKIRRLYGDTLRIPKYDVSDDLSPAEFGYLLDGKVGAAERIAEFVQMEQRGFIKLSGNHKGHVRYKILRHPKEIGRVQLALLFDEEHGFEQLPKNKLLDNFGNNRDVEAIVRKSLISKGWLKKHANHRGLLARLSYTDFLSIAVFLAVLIWLLLTTLIFSELGQESDYIGLLNVLLSVMIAVVGAITIRGLYLAYRKRYLLSAAIASGATRKYYKEWKELYGLALYLRVSGMDTMTPDYTKLTFKDLDKLYPYAVALGADKKVVRILR